MASEAHLFPIAGIGASAGGVEALQEFFEGMPVDTGVGFVVVTHLSPDHESLLHEIIARRTSMPVHVATNAAEVLPDNVYVLPAGAFLGFRAGRLQLRTPANGERERRPIDIFLCELAKDRRDCAVGVILSGGDADGALGVKAIKEHGGLTMAQIVTGSAHDYSEMPESAILTGMIDLAVPVGEMGGRIAEFSRSFAAVESLAAAGESGQEDGGESPRSEICALLRSQTGHDFSGYKPKTFLRRVQRRMQVTHLEALPEYVELLRKEPKEVSALFRDLLISVTNFFRDPEAFEALGKAVIPKLFEGRGADDAIRVWAPGCATGEEVYSIAMLMREHMDGLRNVARVQIFATDIDERALAVARAARYPCALLEGVSEKRRNRFFARDGASFVVSKDVRDLCIFSPHSVLRDPPFSHIDLVSCRNLLIYFGSDAQKQVIPTFRYSLRTGGYLFLGSSENVAQFKELFAPVDKKNRIFRTRDDGASVPRPNLPGLYWPSQVSARSPRTLPPGLSPLRQTVDAWVIEHHSPPHVVVNQDGDIVHFSTRTGKYFEAPAGAPIRQLIPMARKGLRLALRAICQEAANSNEQARRDGVEFESDNGRVQRVSIAAEPLPVGPEERLFLITFTDNGPPMSLEEAQSRPADKDGSGAELEGDLRETRERLQSMIEEYETALEELKASNEELLSVNEEMQSTNEELEVSKEELQSVNEELHTVNVELNAKVEALDHANSDLHNLFENTDVATIFLDRNITIRKFTPAATEIFKILPSDVGRPLTDLSSRLAYPEMGDDLLNALGSDDVFERRTDAVENDAHYLTRIAPYRDSDGRKAGVVMTVMDVSALAQAELHQRMLIAELNHRVNNMLTVVLAIAQRTKRTSPSLDSFYETFSRRLEAMSRSYALLSHESCGTAALEDVVLQALSPFGMERVELKLEPIRLNPRHGLSIGMILHELATNAWKYGALTGEEGRIEFHAARETTSYGDEIALVWREIGGPPAERRSSNGFGLQLIEREASYNLRGGASLEFLTSGLVVRLRFPVGPDAGG
ncbi:CheR family methyltransferase [Hansschlegelia zhihuaiae]|uniref:histidine kinase n=1 Tax=Hansschlegelia zhihuaiae TaxID=405005 RepID=A0A4Q0MCN5_9HYPH|nr:CheR family methyltransferase [Hansschlegelia zhihuaiae]RXF70955.1 chemotaxis protein CheR [Hansschlegelia zhihuaiae]